MKILIYIVLFLPMLTFSQLQPGISQGMAFLKKSESFYQKSEFDSAYYYAKKGYDLFNRIKNDSLITQATLKLMAVTDTIREQDFYFDLLVEKSKKTKNWNLLAETYFTKGRYYFFNDDPETALPFYLKVDSISKKLNLVNESIIWSVLDRSEISRRTFTKGGIEAAHDLQKEALDLAKQLKSEGLMYEVYLRLADMNGLKGNNPEMEHYLKLVYPYYKKTDDVKNLTKVYMNYMNYYYYVNDYDSAGKKLQEGIAYLRTKNDSILLARMVGMYGTYFRKRVKNCVKAIEQLKEAKLIYDKLGINIDTNYMYLMEDMALCSAEINDYKNAYTYYQKTYEIKKELVKKRNNDLTRKLEIRYQTQKKEQEIELLKSQNELAEQQKINQRNLFLGGIGITSLFGVFFFILFRNRQKTTRKLKELDIAKSNFFTNISHEFRTPLTLIQSPIDEELEKNDLSETQRNKFTLIKRNSNRLLSLVDQLLLLSKIEANALKLQVQNTNIHELIAAISASFEYVFKQKHIDYKTEIRTQQHGYLDIDFIEKILSNLLSNASKYTSEDGKVNLDAYIDNNRLHLKVSNLGTALNAEQLQNIFNKFYQVNSHQEGYGIGLTLVKELIEVHKGNIIATSNSNLVTFLATVPIAKSAYSENEIISVSRPIPIEKQFHIQTELTDSYEVFTATEKPILLIVEDNLDMRTFVKSLFKNEFDILEAENGKVGIDIALELVPDIIISDVMMPEKDGIALVEALKNDQKTSHIPIILLTAKVEEEYQIKGILTGADDYITKPFSPKLIHAKMETLLANRDKARVHYSHEVLLKPAIFGINSAEEMFFNKLQDVINSKLQEPDFNVDAFSQEIGMSRMQLHRKLKATLGISASEFLRTERLKAARHLLQTSNLTISEVAYSVGFNDVNYFSKSFIKLFKITPSDFKNKSNP